MIPNCLGYTSDLSIYETNRDILYHELSSIGYEVVKPDGAFYLFVKALEKDAVKFCENAKRFELLLVPSDSFGVSGYVRISYCVSKQTIINSLSAFETLANEYME
jgi:aspartate aminotransferase